MATFGKKDKPEDTSGLDAIANSGILQAMRGDEQKLREMSISGDSEFEQKFSQYAKSVQSQKVEDREVLQGLDGVIKQGEQYRTIVGQMNIQLAKYFNEFQQDLGAITEYEGIEKIAKIFGNKGKAWADIRMYKRLVDQPLDLIGAKMIKHGINIAKIIQREEKKLQEVYGILKKDKGIVTKEYRIAEAEGTKWNQKFEELEAKISELNEKSAVAEPKERAVMQEELEKLSLERDDAMSKRNQYLVVQKRDTEDGPILDKHIDSYAKMISDLQVMRVDTQEYVLHYQNAIPKIKKALEATLAVKGADMYGDQIRSAIAVGTDVVTGAALEISKIAQKSLESKIMTAEEFERQAQKLLKAAEHMEAGVANVKSYVKAGKYTPSGGAGPDDSNSGDSGIKGIGDTGL